MSAPHQDFTTYLSPFSWRYGSAEMRALWSEKRKYELWRQIWVALAEVEAEAGLITPKELQDLRDHQLEIDISQILEFEQETKHDVFAAIKEFAHHAQVGGGKLHLGATSMDIVDNTDVLRMKEGLRLISTKLQKTLQSFVNQVIKYADTPCMGFTHLQPAEPTTIGYRLAFYAQDLWLAAQWFDQTQENLKAKGLKGAVGTAASYTQLLGGTKLSADELEKKVMQKLGMAASIVTSQVNTRQYDYQVLVALANLAAGCAKFAADLRILQSPPFGEWSEPFGQKQVGSSAMPFKKNPIQAEKICSLARYLNQLPAVMNENAMLSYLERTLDDSANKRVVIPEAFLAVDEILSTMQKLIDGLVINLQRVQFNLEQFGPFAATEVVMMASSKKGGDRQHLHEVLRTLSLQAWEATQKGAHNPLQELVSQHPEFLAHLSTSELSQCFEVQHHVGTAAERARQLVKEIQQYYEK